MTFWTRKRPPQPAPSGHDAALEAQRTMHARIERICRAGWPALDEHLHQFAPKPATDFSA